MDRNSLVRRLQELRREYDAGGHQIAELDRRREDLHATLLRIEGAIQVLEEELAKAQDDQVDQDDDSAPPADRFASG